MIYYFDSLDSTQNEAMRRIATLNHKDMIIAKHQTHGRGRYGRQWKSEEGNLMMTLIVKTEDYMGLMYSISKLIKQFLEEYWISGVSIKAPNDILIDGLKVAGILIEPYQEFVLVGIGLNMTHAPDVLDQNVTFIHKYAPHIQQINFIKWIEKNMP